MLSSLYNISADYLLLLLFGLNLFSVLLALLFLAKRQITLLNLSVLARFLATALTVIIFLHLLRAFLFNDFSNIYVFLHSHQRLPLIYKISAIWGGQAGSLLFWLLILSLQSALVVLIFRKREVNYTATLILIFAGVELLFTFLLIFQANPFETFYLSGARIEGKGLNPLLQHPFMAIHPPLLYLGYIGYTVLFALFLANSILQKPLALTLDLVGRTAFFSWLCLTLGNITGAYWAYDVLGWGGYWGWDPVENSALIPWLTGTAFLLLLPLWKRYGVLPRFLVFVGQLTFVLTIFGTFITRSGVISSVHAFAKGSIGFYFLGFMALLIGGLVYSGLRPGKQTGRVSPLNLLSSSALTFFSALCLLISAAVVLWGVLIPLTSELIFGSRGVAESGWYNRYIGPFTLLLLFCLSVRTMGGNSEAIRTLFKRYGIYGLMALLLIAPLAYLLFFSPLPSPRVYRLYIFGLLSFSLLWLLAITFQIRRIWPEKNRLKRFYQISIQAMFLGCVLALVGISGNLFSLTRDIQIRPGEHFLYDGFRAVYQGITKKEYPEYTAYQANIVLWQHQKPVYRLNPARLIYRAIEGARATQVDILRFWDRDLYVAFLGAEPEGLTYFNIKINYLIAWFWIGWIILVISAILNFILSEILNHRLTKG